MHKQIGIQIQKDINVETLDDQYQVVKELTNLSHVMHYGDMGVLDEPVAWFQGESKVHRKKVNYVDEVRRLLGQSFSFNKKSDFYGFQEPYRAVSWPSRDVELMYLHQLKERTNDIFEAKELNRKIHKIHEVRLATTY